MARLSKNIFSYRICSFLRHAGGCLRGDAAV